VGDGVALRLGKQFRLRLELLKRDKVSLDLFWIKDKSLTDTDALQAPDILATEIADDLEAALEQFTKIAAQLGRHSAA